MNEIKLKVNFTKRTILKSGVALTTGDYNSTKLIFDFDREDGLKVFEMKNPNDELVLLSNIENNELILVGHDEDTNVSLFSMPGDYTFEISLYDGDSKLTSASGKLVVKAEAVLIDSEVYEPYTPIFENLINQVNTAINETNNLNLDANRVEDGVEITIVKKDGTTKKVEVYDGQGGSGGTGNYEELENKPRINGHILIGNQTTEDLDLEYDDTIVKNNIDILFETTDEHDRDIQNIQNDIEELQDDVEDIGNEIDIIDSKIPSQATSSNQLADKNFVNSSIATNTAYFRGTFNSVEELQAYSGEKTLNDYAFVIVYDEVITTQVKQYDRYKWNSTQWVYEYTLNNSSFTAQQWASINSGITSGLVDKLNGIEANAQVNDIEKIKVMGEEQAIQNKIVDLDVPTTSVIDDILDRGTTTNGYIEDAVDYKTFNKVVDGNYKQETTVGKNLFDISYAVEKQYNIDGTELTNQNIKYTLSDGIITIHHTNAGNGSKLLNKMLLPAGTYTISATYNSTDYGSDLGYVVDTIRNMDNQTNIVSEYRYLNASQLPVRGSRIFTLTEATNVCFGFTPKNSETGIVTLAEIQLEKGSTATSYEPYTGGQPSPNPDYPQEIEVIEDSVDIKITGKNLFDKNSITDGKWLTTNGALENASNYCVSDYIEVQEGQQYYLQNTDTKRLKYYNSNKVAITNTWDIANSGNQIITIPVNAKYVRFSILKTSIDINTYQFEKGSISTTYEEYKSHTTTIDLQDNFLAKIGDIKDKLIIDKLGNVKLLKKIRHFKAHISDMNNSENYPGWINTEFTKQLYRDYPSQNGTFRSANVNVTSNISTNNNYFSLNTMSSSGVFILNRNYFGSDYTQTYWKTNYPNLVLDFYYELDTPQIIDLGNIGIIKTFKGVNNVEVIANLDTSFSVEYATLSNETSEAIIINATNNTTINGYQVPLLTNENIHTIYNGIVAGKQVVVSDANDNMHFIVNQADTDGDDIFISFLYYDIMILQYDDNGNITYKEIASKSYVDNIVGDIATELGGI